MLKNDGSEQRRENDKTGEISSWKIKGNITDLSLAAFKYVVPL